VSQHSGPFAAYTGGPPCGDLDPGKVVVSHRVLGAWRRFQGEGGREGGWLRAR